MSDDAIEFITYFTSFWRFLFSSNFRERTLNSFKDESWMGKAGSVFLASLCTVCGLAPVVALLVLAAAIYW